MKTLIALSIAITSLTFQVQAQSDTIEFNGTIPTRNLSMDEVHGILMNYLALKCDNWMQVIQLRNTSNGRITLFLKIHSSSYYPPLVETLYLKRTYKMEVLASLILIKGLYTTQNKNLAETDFNSFKTELIKFINYEYR